MCVVVAIPLLVLLVVPMLATNLQCNIIIQLFSFRQMLAPFPAIASIFCALRANCLVLLELLLNMSVLFVNVCVAVGSCQFSTSSLSVFAMCSLSLLVVRSSSTVAVDRLCLLLLLLLLFGLAQGFRVAKCVGELSH